MNGAVETGPDVGPSTHVEWLLLAPNEMSDRGERRNHGLNHLAMEGIELLDADDGRVVDALLFTVID